MNKKILIRNANSNEFESIGKLMVSVYAQLEGFPKETEQQEYYQKLFNVGKLTDQDHTELIVAVKGQNTVVGTVVYFSNLKNYGSGGSIAEIQHASGFRLLAVDPQERGNGIGNLLIQACIQRAKSLQHSQLYIHSTESMKVAWGMYERMGFKRFTQIDFLQGTLPVFGFKLDVKE